MSKRAKLTTVIGNSGGGGAVPDELVEASDVRSYLQDGESLKYVVVGTDKLVRETDDWKTTEEPGSDGGVLLAVTDKGLLFIVGGCRDPDVDGDYVRRVHHADVEEVTINDSLLSSSFTVETRDGVVMKMTPASMDELTTVRQYVTSAHLRWKSAREFLTDLDADLEELESTVAAGQGDEVTRLKNSIYEEIISIGETSSLNSVDLPALDDDLDEAKRRLRLATGRGYCRLARDELGMAIEHRDAGALTDAADSLRVGAEALEKLIVDNGLRESQFGDDDAAQKLEPGQLTEAVSQEQAAICTLLSAESIDTQARTLPIIEDAVEHLDAVLADSGERLQIDTEELEAALEACRTDIAAAYEACANEFADRATTGDDDDQDQRATLGRAIDAIDRRRELARESEYLAVDESLAERREELEAQIERLEWQWVGDA